MKSQRWETRPLDFWQKAKELRASWQDSMSDENLMVGHGNTYFCDWPSAFPAFRAFEDNPNGAMISSKSSPHARKARLASEIRGWGREICGYQNNCWGEQFLGYTVDNEPFPYRQFVIPFHCVCDQHAKRGQQARDFEAMPQWMEDQCMYLGPRDEKREEAMQEHRAYCNLRQLNDVERIFGQKCDDKKLTRLVRAQSLFEEYAREVSRLMAVTIPAPLSVKELYSLYTLGTLTRVDPDETVKLWKMVLDEVKWRADNQIAAVGNERYRWIEAHPPSWHFLKHYRYIEQYGAVCLGSQYTHICDGAFLEIKADGSLGPRKSYAYPEDTPLKTREDIVRYFDTPDARAPEWFKQDEYNRHDALTEFAKMFQADGALLGLWRCGVGCTLTRKEQGMLLKQAGVNVMYYEGSQPGDRTDLDEKRYIDQLDAWMESQGLRKLED